MAFTSTSSLHPAALHSLAKLQPSPLLFLCRSHSSLPPPRKPRFLTPVLGLTSTTSTPSSSSSRPSWIDKWKQTHPMKLPKRPRAVVDYRGSGVSEDDEEEFGTSRSTGSSTMERIVEKLKRYGYVEDVEETKEAAFPEKGSVEDVFYAEDGVLPNTRGGLSSGEELARFPWEKPKEEAPGVGPARRKASKSSLAELTLPAGELRRLRHLAIRMKSKTKIRGAGVTKEIVDKIHDKWKTEEVVRLKCEGPPALNMKRMHEILERKTGGLVIWRSGSSISLYRGVSYELPQPVKKHGVPLTGLGSTNNAKSLSYPSENVDSEIAQSLSDGDASYPRNKDYNRSQTDLKYEHEVDSLLDHLGPRYTDWSGCDPLPVDADLLPGYIPGYEPRFRILPYGVRRSLGMKDQTNLRRLARVLPPHFALGRSRQHQGLAAAMLKLWEKSTIAKIALKRGVQLTTSERMAEDLKKLTGGTLLCRNKDYIVFYRGKDFLAPEVTEALLEREKLAKSLQDEEEQARAKASFSVFSNISTVEESGTAGTLTETQEADARWAKQLDDNDMDKMAQAAEIARHAKLVRKLERKLFLAEKKLAKGERALGKVEEFLKPTDHKPDPESITDEERFMFRKLGLKMKAFLLLGRRGVFDGTVENMHLHWKYRELVKIIVKAKTFARVRNVALSLEAESGGVLVSVDKVSKGFAIIVYRGKDYQRPRSLRPKNLLTKRKALARSIELQRREALNVHIFNMHKRVEKLRSELLQMEVVEGHGDEELYAKLDSTYPSGDEDAEDEDDKSYLETFEGAVDDDGAYVSEDNEGITVENTLSNDDNDISNDETNDYKQDGINVEVDKEDSNVSFHSVINSHNHYTSSPSRDSESYVLYDSHTCTSNNSLNEAAKI